MNKLSQEQPNNATYHGTTTVGLVCSDGVILATDTRVTAGGFIAHKRGKKLLQVSDNLAVTISGGVTDAQNVIDTLRVLSRSYQIEKGVPLPVIRRHASSRTSSSSSRYYPYIAVVIVGGYDKVGGSIYNLDFFGSVLKENVTSTGSGSPVALGVLEEGYRRA